MPFPRSYQATDASLNPAAFALPAAAASSTNSTSVDLGTAYSSGLNPRLAPMEVEVVLPALTTTQLPNTRTVIYDLQDSSDNATFTDKLSAIGTSTGAGGAGAAAAAIRIKLPSTTARYFRVQATTSAGTTSCAAASCYVYLRF